MLSAPEHWEYWEYQQNTMENRNYSQEEQTVKTSDRKNSSKKRFRFESQKKKKKCKLELEML